MAKLADMFLTLRSAQERLAMLSRADKDASLAAVKRALDEDRAAILRANAQDVQKARDGGMKDSMIDRLSLNDSRIDGMIESIDVVLRQDDPVGRVLSGWTLPNGLEIERQTVPLGVVAIIYESRPNVTVDAFCLAFKAGCSILLRGSSAALESNRVLVSTLKRALSERGLADAVELADSGSHDDVDEILNARGNIDVVIPRGGHSLIQRVVQNAKVPVIETGEGNCHIFVDSSANIDDALNIIENSKVQKPGACNAVETVLLHPDIAGTVLAALVKRLAGRVELRLCARSRAALEAIVPAAELPANLVLKDAVEEDWGCEFLDYILAFKVVDSVDEAVTHINRWGTKHSEAIVTNNLVHAAEFEKRVDAACVYVNASIRFTDGGEFGFGAELGISTQKFHARGPMGLEALTTIKYRVHGNGQVRPD